MNRTETAVADRFQRLLGELQPLASELDAAKRHKATIELRLGNRIEIQKARWVGSHAKGTAIRSVSDVDLLVVVRRGEVRRGTSWILPATLLRWFRADLGDAFKSTRVRRDGRAVVVSFGGGSRPIDVVPAVYVGPLPNGYPLFQIPDPEGKWVQSSPEAHQKYFAEQDQACAYRLRRVVQLVKHWMHSRSPAVPMSAFYTEMVLASEGSARRPGQYSVQLARAFETLAARQCRGIRDPLAISGVISSSRTEDMRLRASAALVRAARLSRMAVDAEMDGNLAEAVRLWTMLYNSEFPQRP